MELSVVQIGFIASLLTEIFKLFPVLGNNSLTKSLVAIMITTVIVYFYGSEFSTEGIVMALVVALTSYKMVIKPVAKQLDFSTQK